MTSRIHRAAGAIGLALVSLTLSARAQASVIRFTNALGTSQWQQPGNWDLNRTPNYPDDVIVNGGFTVVIVASGGAACRTLSAASPLQLHGKLTVFASANLAAGMFMFTYAGSFPILENKGTISIGSFWNWFEGWVTQDVGAD